jgi:hypothetical protein
MAPLFVLVLEGEALPVPVPVLEAVELPDVGEVEGATAFPSAIC